MALSTGFRVCRYWLLQIRRTRDSEIDTPRDRFRPSRVFVTVCIGRRTGRQCWPPTSFRASPRLSWNWGGIAWIIVALTGAVLLAVLAAHYGTKLATIGTDLCHAPTRLRGRRALAAEPEVRRLRSATTTATCGCRSAAVCARGHASGCRRRGGPPRRPPPSSPHPSLTALNWCSTAATPLAQASEPACGNHMQQRR